MLVFDFETLTLNENGQPQPRQHRSVQGHVEALTEAVRLELVWIPGGTFLMGAPQSEEGWHPTQSPQHLVTIAPFGMTRYPITQKQWQVVANLPKVNLPLSAEPSCFSGDDRPVEQVSWFEATEFCHRLTQQTGRFYRLPSEAEWEYACRAGTTTPFHFGATITTDVANYSGVNWEYQGKICSKGSYGQGPQGADRRETVAVGHFGIANAFGLYDMHGQVREWCEDCWHNSYDGSSTDGQARIGASDQRVLRGGSWNGSPKTCRSAFRSKLDPESRLYDVGFRIVCAN